MKKFLAIMIFLVVLVGTSQANIVYVTSDSLGVIRVNGVTSVDIPELRYTGLRGDPLVGSYMTGSAPYIMVVDRASNSAYGDTALIFSASDLTAPKQSVTLTGVFNTKAFASSYNGNSIFFASRGNTSIIEFDTASIDIPINAYIYSNDLEDADYEPELLDMALEANYIYALFRAAPDKVKLYAFDGQLLEGIPGTRNGLVRDDATSLAALASNRVAVAAEGGLSIADVSTIRTVISSDNPITAVCRDTGTGLYYIEQSDSGQANLYHYNYAGNSLTIVDMLYDASDCQLVKDTEYNVMAAMVRDRIYLYDMDRDELINSFSSAELGGVPLNMTSSRAIYDDGSRSSSNCDVSGLGAIMMSVLGFGLMRRRR